MSRESRVRFSAKLFSPWLLAAGFAVAGALGAAALPKPSGLAVDEGDAPRIHWSPVAGASLYRVAVFDAADAEGKRPLLAAVWVKGDAWAYGTGAVVPKAGKLASTKPLPLPAGRTLRVMVAAASADGADKSEWSGADFRVAAPEPTPAPTPAPSPTAADPQLESVSASATGADAEIELEGGEEFRSVPDPAVLDVEDGAAAGEAAAGAAGVAGSAAAAGAGAGAGAAAATGASGDAAAASPSAAAEEVSLARAQSLLKAGRFEDAEAQFRALLKEDEDDADAWEGLGDSLAARRMKAEAYEAYQHALKLDGSRKRLKDWIGKNVPRR